MKNSQNKKDKYFSKIIILASIIFLLLLILLGLTAWRNSQAEIGDLKVSEKIDASNKSINPNNKLSSKAENIYVSGRLAHVRNTQIIIEFMNEDDNNYEGYPKTVGLSVYPYPNNYFAIKLDDNSCKSCNGDNGWQTGKKKVKIHVVDDRNPNKTQVEFETIK